MQMRNRFISNRPFHDPKCESINIEDTLMYYTDILMLANIDQDDYDNYMEQLARDVSDRDERTAYRQQENYFMKLYYQSEKDRYFWEYCPFSTYRETFQFRLNLYLKISKDALPKDFYIRELIDLCEMTGSDIEEIQKPTFDFSTFYRRPRKIKISGHSGGTFREYEAPFFSPTIEDTQKRKIEYILTKLNDETEVVPISSEFPEHFRVDGYNLFQYLEENYTKDDKNLKAKYSNIFHYLYYHQFISCTQEDYKKFILKERGVSMSKILPKQAKYQDDIFPLLTRLRGNFRR